MKIRALIVEDEPAVRQVIKLMLSLSHVADFHFTEASDGAEALEKFDPHRTDLVFLDWNLPRLSGIGFLKRIRAMQTARRPRVIMVTGERSFGKVEEALDEAGADEYVTKPFTPDELSKPVRKLVAEIVAEREQQGAAPAGLFGRLFA
jgi:DNA-binding response OmpR family regulator